MANYRTSLKRARGLGSAHGGTEHFWRQRVTAIANIFLVAFLVYAIISLLGAPLPDVKAFFSSPLNAVLGVLLAISVTTHMRLGMQAVIEDYIHAEGAKVLALLLNTFFSILVGVATVLAVAKLYFGG